MKTRECKQEKCALRGTGQCPICSECGINPDIVSENCVRCWNCEHDEGILRGKPRSKEQIAISQLTKIDEEIGIEEPKKIIEITIDEVRK